MNASIILVRSWLPWFLRSALFTIAIAAFPFFTSTVGATERIVFLGDSLTAGYGLDPDQAYPALIGERLENAGLDAVVVNAGVSGDTSAGGLRRLQWSLGTGKTDILVVALGGNDGLRGFPPGELQSNLTAIIAQARDTNPAIHILLAGMRMPASMGESYQKAFAAVYPQVAEETGVTLIPFLLEGVAGDPKLNLPDRIHPNEEGQAVIAETVWPFIKNTAR